MEFFWSEFESTFLPFATDSRNIHFNFVKCIAITDGLEPKGRRRMGLRVVRRLRVNFFAHFLVELFVSDQFVFHVTCIQCLGNQSLDSFFLSLDYLPALHQPTLHCNKISGMLERSRPRPPPPLLLLPVEKLFNFFLPFLALSWSSRQLVQVYLGQAPHRSWRWRAGSKPLEHRSTISPISLRPSPVRLFASPQ
jgi:hypothetical protein